MTITEPTTEFNRGYSAPGAEAVPWQRVADMLERAEMFWLSTVRADGRPHVTPLPAVWTDGAVHICTGEPEQKTKNLAREPRCVLSTGANRFRDGLDVVVEGTAVRVTGRDRLVALAALWKDRLDWDFEVADAGFIDPAGRDGLVHAVRPDKVLAFGKDPYSQTRYRFS